MYPMSSNKFFFSGKSVKTKIDALASDWLWFFFDFSSTTTPWIMLRLDKEQVLDVLFRLCFWRCSTKMAVLASYLLRLHFNRYRDFNMASDYLLLLYFNCCMNFNLTGSKIIKLMSSKEFVFSGCIIHFTSANAAGIETESRRTRQRSSNHYIDYYWQTLMRCRPLKLLNKRPWAPRLMWVMSTAVLVVLMCFLDTVQRLLPRLSVVSPLDYYIFNFSRTAWWSLMKLGRDEVLTNPHKCCCFSIKSVQGRGQNRSRGWGSPSSKNFRPEGYSSKLHSIINGLEACG